MLSTLTKRPRNVNTFQAASILYGDWGTSKAYVIGLAFALAGYSSFWLIAGVCLLMALVAFNYVIICKFSPSGGGVYAAARKRSEVLALIGAFFLIADYLVTAALSAFASFSYLGVAYPEFWAIGAIAFIGLINFLGPRYTGSLALFVTIPTVVVVILLGIVVIPHLGEAVRGVKPLEGGFFVNWSHFVGMIVALSGIEAIANTTGVMQLDPGSTENRPSVYQTSTKAILIVMIEVCFFTGLFGLAINALPDLVVVHGEINGPGSTNIENAMLKYMGETFLTQLWGPDWGVFFGYVIGLAFATLLLSAVNTALVALTSLLFVMSRDGELPTSFQKISRFGVPFYSLMISTVGPIVILLFVNDLIALADLYAVGFVGAIATNLGSTSLDSSVPLSKKERYLMFFTFLIMAAIEITLFIIKPSARRFVLSILTGGLILRSFVWERRQRKTAAAKKVKLKHASLFTDDTRTPLHEGAMLCSVRSVGKTLNFALEEAKKNQQPLYILYIREQKVITGEDKLRVWLDDEEACAIFDYAKDSSHDIPIKFFYIVSDSPVDSIVTTAKDLRVSRLILGKARHSDLLQRIRGNIANEVSKTLPADIDLIVIS